MRFPTAVRIAGCVWRIFRRRHSTMKNDAGRCNYARRSIDVVHGLTPFDTKDTLLHETFHAILDRAGFERPEEEEEKYVNALATGLIGVLQDNQEFARWLIEPITPSP